MARVRRSLLHHDQEDPRPAAKRVRHCLPSDDTATSTIKEPAAAASPNVVQGLMSNRDAITPLPMQLLLPKTGLTFAMCSCDMDAAEADLLSPSSSLESSDFLFFRTSPNLCTNSATQPPTPASAGRSQQHSMLHAPWSFDHKTASSDFSAQPPQHTPQSIHPHPPPHPSFAQDPLSNNETGVATARGSGTNSPDASPPSPIGVGHYAGDPPAAPRRRLPQQRFVPPRQLGAASSLGTLPTPTPTPTQANNRLPIQSIQLGHAADSFYVGLPRHTEADHTQSPPSGLDAPSLPLESSPKKKRNGISSPRIRSAPFGALTAVSHAPYQDKSSHQSKVSNRPNVKADQSDQGSLRSSPAPLEPWGQNCPNSSPGAKSVPAPKLLQSLLEYEEAQQGRAKALQLQASRESLSAELHLDGRRPVPLASTAGLLRRLALERSN